jgi:hypothetical protein
VQKVLGTVHSALGDTGGRGNDSGVGPVVEGGEPDPGDHEAGGEGPSDHVAAAVASGLSSEFPESRQIHIS